MNSQQLGEIRMVPVAQIEVINPRERNGRVFKEIVDNIKTIGLKKAYRGHTASDGRRHREIPAGVR